MAGPGCSPRARRNRAESNELRQFSATAGQDSAAFAAPAGPCAKPRRGFPLVPGPRPLRASRRGFLWFPARGPCAPRGAVPFVPYPTPPPRRSRPARRRPGSLEAEVAELAGQRVAPDAEELRGARAVAVGGGQDAEDLPPLDLGQGQLDLVHGGARDLGELALGEREVGRQH